MGFSVNNEGVSVGFEKSLLLDFIPPDTQQPETLWSGDVANGFSYTAEEVSVSNDIVPSKFRIFTSDNMPVATGDIQLQTQCQSLDTIKFNYKFKINNST